MNWDIMDFIVIGVLLGSAALIYAIAARKFTSRKQRTMLALIIAMIVAVIWIEIGVGIFNTPFAGN